MKSISILLCCVIIITSTNCSSSELSNQFDKIELMKIDNVEDSIKPRAPAILSKYNVVVVGCIPHFPKTEISVTNFELFDSNKQIISAKPVGGENAITNKINYPELAKRGDIEGNVWIEFKVNKTGNATELKMLKDIGGGCGDEVINAVSLAKFYPGKLLKKNIESRYRAAIQFKIIPISKEEELELRQLHK